MSTVFQPTRPLRGATITGAIRNPIGGISTHAPLAGRDGQISDYYPESGAFQPTRPLRGATLLSYALLDSSSKFQPTRPLRGATRPVVDERRRQGISTHAPLAGRDVYVFQHYFLPQKFQPTRPLRGATINLRTRIVRVEFQPTRPLRGATTQQLSFLEVNYISTHAPLAGRDVEGSNRIHFQIGFQPTRPLRGATGARRRVLT